LLKTCFIDEVEVKRVLADIKEHPSFDEESFKKRDFDALIETGGDVCTITFWAIHLDDAINDK